MENLIYDEVKALKTWNDTPQHVTIKKNKYTITINYAENKYRAGDSRIYHKPIEVPIDDLLRQTEKSKIDEVSDRDIKQYAYERLCRDVLGELGDVEVSQNGDRKVISLRIKAGGRDFETSSLTWDGKRELEEIMNMMAEELEPFPSTGIGEDILESGIGDIIYSSAVSRMKMGKDSLNHCGILDSIYNLNYADGDYATSEGDARKLAQNSGGYMIASQGLNQNQTIIDIAREKIRGINGINRIYTEMVRAGICEPYDQPMSSRNIYLIVSENWTKYIDDVIKDAINIHDTWAPREIENLGDISGRQRFTGTWYPEAPWLQHYETVIFNPNLGDFRAHCLGVSCAIANHYMDGISIIGDERGEYHLPTTDIEKEIAVSQRMKKLGISQQYRPSSFLHGIYDIQLNRRNFRRILQSEMITGLTLENEGERAIDGELFAATSIGYSRGNQEDAVLLLKDGDIPGFKMMLVADGVGGESLGEDASNYLTRRIKQWFENLSVEEKVRYYGNPYLVNTVLNELIKNASSEIYIKYNGESATTLVCAVVGEKSTIISNVGDSRGYAIKDGKISQVTTDDSVVQQMYEEGRIPNRDVMRFHKDARFITQGIGYRDNPVIHSRILSNDDYDMLVIASDGVTDCLYDNEIAVITRGTDSQNPAKRLIQRALNRTLYRPSYLSNSDKYEPTVRGGDDNTTAAVFKKRDEREDR